MRLTLKENICIRLIGLGIFFAPNSGVNFIASVIEGVNARVAKERGDRMRSGR